MGFGTEQIFTKQTGITVSGHVKPMPFAECGEEGGGWHCETRVEATVAYTVLPPGFGSDETLEIPPRETMFPSEGLLFRREVAVVREQSGKSGRVHFSLPTSQRPQSHFKPLGGLVVGLLGFRTLGGSLLGPKPLDEEASRLLVLVALGWASLGQGARVTPHLGNEPGVGS